MVDMCKMPVKCPKCNKIFKNTQGLSGHMRVKHNSQSPVYSSTEYSSTEQSDKIPISLTQRLKELQRRKELRPFEENELLFLELENKRMREELSGIKPIEDNLNQNIIEKEKGGEISSNVAKNNEKSLQMNPREENQEYEDFDYEEDQDDWIEG
jgi:hypothetical protein